MNMGIPVIDAGPDCWWMLADVLASMLYTGKAPEVLQAIELVAAEEQIATTPIDFMGDPRYRIDPKTDDVFTKVVELKSEFKERAESEPEHADYWNAMAQGIKLLANSTSYGIFVEVDEDDPTEEAKPVVIHAMSRWTTTTNKLERPGKYAFAPLGALIPAGGRLLTAIAEKLATDRGISYAHIDTDGITLTKPKGMTRDAFYRFDQEIADWFRPLSPYAGKAELLELEKQNRWEGHREPLYFLGVSDKRYVLYNLYEDDAGPIRREGKRYNVRIRKFSSHGQGTYAPLKDYLSPVHIPEPCEKNTKGEPDSSKLGGQRWSYDLWYDAIVAFETDVVPRSANGSPLYEVNPQHPWLQKPAFLQTTLSTWDLLTRYSSSYRGHLLVRPFSFFTLLPAFHGTFPIQHGSMSHRVMQALLDGSDKDLYRDIPSDTSFDGPFIRTTADLEAAIAEGSFGWNDLDGVRHSLPVGIQTKTIAEAYQYYFRQPEFKSADPTGCGDLPVRHVIITGLAVCGKEGNAIAVDRAEETDGQLGGIEDVQVYGTEPVDVHGYRLSDLMIVTRMSKTTLTDIRRGKYSPSDETKEKLAAGVQLLNPHHPGGIAGWRDIDNAVLAEAMGLDWTEQDIQRIRNGLRVLTTEERERFIGVIRRRLGENRGTEGEPMEKSRPVSGRAQNGDT